MKQYLKFLAGIIVGVLIVLGIAITYLYVTGFLKI